MLTVAVVGPESTGKTDFARSFASRMEATYVPEFSRQFLTDLQRPYVKDDLVDITKGQLQSQERAKQQGSDLIVFDTDLLVMKVWSEFKYGSIDPFIAEKWKQNRCDFYVLTYYDIPYEEDPLRENPDQRPELFEVYENELKLAHLPYVIVKGSREERIAMAIAAINNIS